MKCLLLSLGFVLSVSVASAQPASERPGSSARSNQAWIQEKPALGSPAPDFKLADLKGEEVRLKDLMGKRPIVVEFGSYT